MKRLIIIILSIIISSVVVFADASFDKTINYQFNNAEAYIGEILYLMPITGSYYDCPHYPRFKSFEADENDITYNAITNQYKYDPFDYRDYKYAGTHKRHIEGHKFRVDNVLQYIDYNDESYLDNKIKYLKKQTSNNINSFRQLNNYFKEH